MKKNGDKNNRFIYMYLLKTNRKINEYRIQKEELSEVKYFTIKEIEEAIHNKNTDFAFYNRDYAIKALTKLKEIYNI